MTTLIEDPALVAEAKGDSKKLSELYKDKGNGFFKDNKYDEAIDLYTLSIKHNADNEKALLNRAFCHIKKENWALAEEDCCAVLKSNSKHPKALYRRGQARIGLKQLEQAQADLKLASVLEPTSNVIRVELSRCEAMIKPLAGIPLTARWRRISAYQYSSDISKPAEVCSHSRHIKFVDEAHKKSLTIEKEFYREDPPSMARGAHTGSGKAAKPILSTASNKVVHQPEESQEKTRSDVKKPRNAETVDGSSSISNKENTTEATGSVISKLSLVNTSSDDDNSGTCTPIEAAQPEMDVDYGSLKDMVASGEKVDVPPVPATYFQFKADWTSLGKTSGGMCYSLYRKYVYLSAINAELLRMLLGSGLEADFLADISLLMEHAFLPRCEKKDADALSRSVELLESLARLPRFSLCYMFLDDARRSALSRTAALLAENGRGSAVLSKAYS